MKLLLIALFIAAFGLTGRAQTAIAYPLNFSSQWQTTTGYVPNSSTSVTTVDSYVDQIYLANTSASSVNCTLTDASTNCGGGVCSWWPTVSIAANTVYLAQTNGVYSPGGVKWSCTSASVIVGWIKGKYPVVEVAMLGSASMLFGLF